MTVAFYVGGTGTGKTTLMVRDAFARAASRAVPLLLLDSEGVAGKSAPEAIQAPTLHALADLIWKDGRHARYIPRDESDVEALAHAIRVAGGVVFAIDEVSYWARGNLGSTELAKLFRVHRHSGVDIYATSQYPADIGPLVWNVKSEVFIFRNESPLAVDRLRASCALTPDQIDQIPTLPDYQFIPWRSVGANRLES